MAAGVSTCLLLVGAATGAFANSGCSWENVPYDKRRRRQNMLKLSGTTKVAANQWKYVTATLLVVVG